MERYIFARNNMEVNKEKRKELKANNSAELLQEFNAYLHRKRFASEPKELYEPVNYILSLGGKRIRPILVLLSSQLYNSDISASYPLALAIEIFHNFTLVHDDIMDDSELRRGMPTVHSKYDLSTGILSGDVMLMYAYKYLLEVEDPIILKRLICRFTDVSIQICEGQQMDINFENESNPKIESYLKMIELKTAVLLALSLEIGGILNHASDDDIMHLKGLGLNLGISFQLQDDQLDVFSEDQGFGKKMGGDIIQKKKTYLYLKALQLADANQKSTLLKLYHPKDQTQEDEKINTVKSIFKRLNVEEYSNQLKQAYTDLAYSHLNAISVSEDQKQPLKNIADMLLNRTC